MTHSRYAHQIPSNVCISSWALRVVAFKLVRNYGLGYSWLKRGFMYKIYVERVAVKHVMRPILIPIHRNPKMNRQTCIWSLGFENPKVRVDEKTPLICHHVLLFPSLGPLGILIVPLYFLWQHKNERDNTHWERNEESLQSILRNPVIVTMT